MIYPLPVFAEFDISSDCVANLTDDTVVYFTLVNGVDDIDCSIQAKRKVEKFEVCTDGNVQNAVDRDFEYLEVDCETEVLVELDYVQKIKLTEKQMLKLNEYLKDEMKMI